MKRNKSKLENRLREELTSEVIHDSGTVVDRITTTTTIAKKGINGSLSRRIG